MVKEILLSVAGVWTEMLLAKISELGGANRPFFREVFFSEHPCNPNVDGHHFQPSESK